MNKYTAFGKTLSAYAWSKEPECKPGYLTLLKRLAWHRDVEQALTEPCEQRRVAPLSTEVKDNIRRCYKRGMTTLQIAHQLEISPHRTRTVLKHLGPEFSNRQNVRYRSSFCRLLHKLGMSRQEIAYQIGLSMNACYKVMAKHPGTNNDEVTIDLREPVQSNLNATVPVGLWTVKDYGNPSHLLLQSESETHFVDNDVIAKADKEVLL